MTPLSSNNYCKNLCRTLSVFCTLFTLMVGVNYGTARAQSAWPTQQPINLIVSYSPGGGTDLTARLLAPFLEKYLGNNARIVVVNRTGAGGAIGFSELARAKPDGYTIGFLNTPNLITIPIERESSFHWTDFDLLGNVVDDPGSFAINTTHSDIKTLDELAAFAKANPGKITVGTTGVGSDDHLAMLLFQRQTGAKLTHVPYKGSGSVRTAISGGEITMAAMNIGEISAYIKGGSPLRALGVMSEARADVAPHIPTFREQGYDIIMASLRGIGAPKGLPIDIRERLVRALAQAVADPEFSARAKEAFNPMRYLPPEEYRTLLRDTENLFQDFWKELPWSEN